MSSTVDAEKGTSEVAITTPEETYLVGFTPTDPENPQNWPWIRKWAVTGVLSATGFNRIMVSTIMAPALPTIGREFNMGSTESVMAMSVYLLATAFGPLLIGPLSEVYGRRPVLHATNLWFLVWNIVCGFAPNKGVLIAARFLAGFGASAIYALASGVLGDVWSPEQRGRSLSLYLLIPLLGAAVGPILGGFITENTTWRWMFWSTSILQGVFVVVSIPLFHESHAPTLLHRRAVDLRESTGDDRYHTKDERLEAGKSIPNVLIRAISRPTRLLLFHPIVQIQAILSALNYGLLYFILSTFSVLYIDQYDNSIEISGLHYIAIVAGELIAAQISGPLMDYSYSKMKAAANGIAVPEFRVPQMFPGQIFAAVGLFWYGWAAEKHGHWILVDIGAVILAFGMQYEGQATQAYIIDSYTDHASSASAASQFLRSLSAFGFPLFAPQMYKAMGYGWGNTTLGLAALGIGVPATFAMWIYGAKLRARSRSSY